MATSLDDDLQDYLARSKVDWRLREEPAHLAAEAEWRSILAQAAGGRRRLRTGARAEYEYLQQLCAQYLIVPFRRDVGGLAPRVYRHSLGACQCCGSLVPFGAFCDAEFFVSSLDFEWTMVHTLGDHELGGPRFIRQEWVQ